MPSKKNMKRWFADNPDGVGISFQYHGKVRTIKGAMTIEEMFQLVNKMNSIIKSEGKQIEDIDLLIQFRRAVTGRVCPEFCHPFPVSPHQKELDSLDVISELAFAHNGIIWEYTHTKTWKSGQWYGTGEDINDAQEFIKDYIVGMGMAVHNKSVQELIISYTDSKFAILSAKGIDYIGFYYKEKGLLFSNEGYKPRKPIVQSKYPLTATYLTHGVRPSTYGSALWEGENMMVMAQVATVISATSMLLCYTTCPTTMNLTCAKPVI